MSAAVALLLLGGALLVWPVPRPVERRLQRLRLLARVAGTGPAAPVGRVPAAADRGRALVAGGLLAVTALGGLGGGPAGAVAAGAVASAATVVTVAARRARVQARRRRDLLTALAVLRGELDAGTPFPAALAAARARAGTAVAALFPGGGAADGLEHARRCLTAGAALVAATGAAWSAVVAGVARDLYAHDAREREVAAALAGARASTVVLAALPLLGVGLAAGLGADPLHVLLGTPGGRWVLAAGAVLDLLGVVGSTLIAGRAAR